MAGTIEEGARDLHYSSELIRGFANSLRKLIPNMELAGVAWKDCEQYDNFDRIAEVLWQELVMHPLTYKSIGEEKSFRYDMPPYRANWGEIRVFSRSKFIEDLGIFVRISSIDSPMDTVVYSSNGEQEVVRLADVEFGLILV